jgi:hypothetical protein
MPEGVAPEKWETLGEKMRELAEMQWGQQDWSTMNRLQRDCAARMLNLFSERV